MAITLNSAVEPTIETEVVDFVESPSESPNINNAPAPPPVVDTISGIDPTDIAGTDDTLFFMDFFNEYQNKYKEELGADFRGASYLVSDPETGHKVDLLRENFSSLPPSIKEGLMQGRIDLTAPQLAAQEMATRGNRAAEINASSFVPEEERQAQQAAAADRNAAMPPPNSQNPLLSAIGGLVASLTPKNKPKIDKTSLVNFKKTSAKNYTSDYNAAKDKVTERMKHIMNEENSMGADIKRALDSGHPGELEVIAAKIKAKQYDDADIKQMNDMKYDLKKLDTSFKKALKSNKGTPLEDELASSHKNLLESLEKSSRILFDDAGKSMARMLERMMNFIKRHLIRVDNATQLSPA